MQFYLIENSAHLRSHTSEPRALDLNSFLRVICKSHSIAVDRRNRTIRFYYFCEIFIHSNFFWNIIKIKTPKAIRSKAEEIECINWNACWAERRRFDWGVRCSFADADRMHLGDDKSVSRRKSASELMAIKLCAKCVVKLNETQWQDISWRPTAYMIESRRRLFWSRLLAFVYLHLLNVENTKSCVTIPCTSRVWGKVQ